MATLLLTIAGPARRADFAAASDARVGELLQPFIDLTASPGAHGPSGWTVRIEGADRPLPAEAPLHEAGVVDGAVLELRPPPDSKSTPSPPPEESNPPASALAQQPTPTTRSGLLDRVRGAWRAPEADPALDARIRDPRLAKPVTIAVLAAEPSSGTTTIALLLAKLFATAREDRVVAVDGDPGPASLGARLPAEGAVYADDLLDLVGSSELSTELLDAHLGATEDGLKYVPGPPDELRREAMDRKAHLRLLELLKSHLGITVIDCTAGLERRSVQAAVTAADQVVLVTAPDGLPQADAAAHRLVRSWVPFVLAVNRVPRRGPAGLSAEELERRFPDADAILTLREDRRAAESVDAGTVRWDEVTEPWSGELRSLAAALADGWSDLELTAA